MWDVPKMWEGGECWIIGGGPSIPYEFGVPEELINKVQAGEASISEYSPYLSPIHDKHVIGINAAFLLGTWIDLLFFGDPGFYWKNRRALLAYPRPKISCAKSMNPDGVREGVKYIPKHGGKSRGISRKRNHIAWNTNSGFASLSLAYDLGVKKIYLLGFDMSLDEEGNQHWHRHYRAPGKKKNPKKVPFPKHMTGYNAVLSDATTLGLEIINVSQNSTIQGFKKQTIKEIFG